MNATTSWLGSSRKTTLKSWKSRPAAPRMTTRVRCEPVLVHGVDVTALVHADERAIDGETEVGIVAANHDRVRLEREIVGQHREPIARTQHDLREHDPISGIRVDASFA